MDVRFEVVGPNTNLLRQVIELGDKNTKTLGMLPRRAIADHAAKGLIIAAVNGNGEVIGYLLYRRTKSTAVVVHLCVAENLRRQGLASAIFEQFKNRNSTLSGARVTCRTDYEASNLWPKLGFQHAGLVKAKKKGKLLQFWWLPFNRQGLFSDPIPQPVVLDCNIVFDTLLPDREDKEEALALAADWLADTFELCTTPELAKEINRTKDDAERRRLLRESSEFRVVVGATKGADQVKQMLMEILSSPKTASDESDLRQLTHAIQSQAKYFVTRDEKLLRRWRSIYSRFGVAVLRPSTLINKFDQETRPRAYVPSALSQTPLTIRPIVVADIAELMQTFCSGDSSESRTVTKSLLHSALAHPENSQTELVLSEDAPLAFSVIDRSQAPHRIVLLRAIPGKQGASVGWHLLWRATSTTADLGIQALEFTDGVSTLTFADALVRMGFLFGDGRWVKVLLSGSQNVDAVRERLENLSSMGFLPPSLDTAVDIEKELVAETRQQALLRLEKAVWPGLVTGVGVGHFVVPIKPQWALELFDTEARRVFDRGAKLLLSFENAYYRSGSARILTVPSRILWYYSQERKHPESKSIRAHSILNEVVVDTPDSVYERYKHYGVFSKRLIRERASKSGLVTAFMFSHTQMLSKPIPLQSVRQFYRERGLGFNGFVCPTAMVERDWLDLLDLGTKG